jgi:hypothetical protein
MPSDQNTNQNPISEENSSPTSHQEPTPPLHEALGGQGEPAPKNTAHSEPSAMPLEAPEAPRGDFEVKSNDILPLNSTFTEQEKEPEIKENQEQKEPEPEPISELEKAPESETVSRPEQTPEPSTAQIPVNEPMRKTSVSVDEPIDPTGESLDEPVLAPLEALSLTGLAEPTPVSQSQPTQSSPQAEAKPPQAASISSRDLARSLLAKARSAIQSRKRKKLDKIMILFLKNSKITNDEVEKFLHVSDATATRYLSQLEKEGKIKQNGKTGHVVFYSKI